MMDGKTIQVTESLGLKLNPSLKNGRNMECVFLVQDSLKNEQKTWFIVSSLMPKGSILNSSDEWSFPHAF